MSLPSITDPSSLPPPIGAIRRLTHADHRAVMDYVLREPEINLFIIGDIEHFGYEHDQVEHWGQFGNGGNLLGMLTRYYDGLVFYSREEYDLEGFARLMLRFDFRLLCGESSIVEPFTGILSFSKRVDDVFCRLGGALRAEDSPLLDRVRKADLDTAAAIARFLQSIEEFGGGQDEREISERLVGGIGRVFYLEERGQIVSVAQTAAENRHAAMVIGVATHPACRRRGFASACMTKLCRELLGEGLHLCLFYHNPEAGGIYRRLGFEPIGAWTLLTR